MTNAGTNSATIVKVIEDMSDAQLQSCWVPGIAPVKSHAILGMPPSAAQKSGSASIDTLCQDLSLMIASYLHWQDLVQLGSTCHAWQRLTSHDEAWSAQIANTFGTGCVPARFCPSHRKGIGRSDNHTCISFRSDGVNSLSTDGNHDSNNSSICESGCVESGIYKPLNIGGQSSGLARPKSHTGVRAGHTPFRSTAASSGAVCSSSESARNLFYRLLISRPKSILSSEWEIQVLGAARLGYTANSLEEPSSPFGRCATFYDVYLRSLSGTFSSVPPGKYSVVWRIKLDDVTVGSPTTFSADVRRCAVSPTASISPSNSGCISLSSSDDSTATATQATASTSSDHVNNTVSGIGQGSSNGGAATSSAMSDSSTDFGSCAAGVDLADAAISGVACSAGTSSDAKKCLQTAASDAACANSCPAASLGAAPVLIGAPAGYCISSAGGSSSGQGSASATQATHTSASCQQLLHAGGIGGCTTTDCEDMQGGHGFVSKWDKRHWSAMECAYGNGVWFEAVVGVVDLRKRCHVDVRLCNLDVDWKGSVFLDYAVLRPCE